MGKFMVGIILALSIGGLCRVAGLPLPVPPVLIGALLVVAMTSGHMVGDRMLARRAATSDGAADA